MNNSNFVHTKPREEFLWLWYLLVHKFEVPGLLHMQDCDEMQHIRVYINLWTATCIYDRYNSYTALLKQVRTGQAENLYYALQLKYSHKKFRNTKAPCLSFKFIIMF